MTELPWPDHLLTIEEWDALPEDTSRHFELVEGVLVVAPRPAPLHQRAAYRLAGILDTQVPGRLAALPDVDVVVDATFLLAVEIIPPGSASGIAW